MRQLSAWALASALPVLVALACSDDSNGPMDPGPLPGEAVIAFSSDRDGDFEIYVMKLRGGRPLLRLLRHLGDGAGIYVGVLRLRDHPAEMTRGNRALISPLCR